MKTQQIWISEEQLEKAIDIFLDEWDSEGNGWTPTREDATKAISEWIENSIKRALESPEWYGFPASAKNTSYPEIDWDLLGGEI